MKSNKELLSSVLKTTQMGQIGIRSALDCDMKPELRKAMESQLREYDCIESEAHEIAKERRWELPEINPSVRFMTDQMLRMRISFGNADSKIAAMMIWGNTSGIIKGHKNLHRTNETDAKISALTQKLLQTEAQNVNQMKPFL